MSCSFGESPAPLTGSFFSLIAVVRLRLLPSRAPSSVSPCRCATSRAICAPRALNQGPVPIRSRALIAGLPSAACVLRYACQVRPPAPTAAASFWQWASAPARPPRSAPLPAPVLVTKKVKGLAGSVDRAGCCAATGAGALAAGEPVCAQPPSNDTQARPMPVRQVDTERTWLIESSKCLDGVRGVAG